MKKSKRAKSVERWLKTKAAEKEIKKSIKAANETTKEMFGTTCRHQVIDCNEDIYGSAHFKCEGCGKSWYSIKGDEEASRRNKLALAFVSEQRKDPGCRWDTLRKILAGEPVKINLR